MRAMLRHRRFLGLMHRLALLGALLMVVAPVVSRWLQGQDQAEPLRALAALCTSGGLRLVDRAGAASQPAGHGDHAPGLAMDMAAMGHAAPDGMPADHHDGMACDYCLLAARLLPFVLILLLLPLLQAAPSLLPEHRAPPRQALPWPAHAARGPPHTLVA